MTPFRISGVAMIAMMTALYSVNAAAQPAISRGDSFAKVRDHLLKAGWVPVRTALKLSDGTPENNYGDSALFFSAGIKEVQACSGTGRNFCLFNYRKGKQCLQVGTIGEYGVGSGPEIESWEYKCPSAASPSK